MARQHSSTQSRLLVYEHFLDLVNDLVVREPAVGLIMWLRPKGLKVYSYTEKYAEFKNQSLKKSVGTQSCYAQRNPPWVASSKISKK